MNQYDYTDPIIKGDYRNRRQWKLGNRMNNRGHQSINPKEVHPVHISHVSTPMVISDPRMSYQPYGSALPNGGCMCNSQFPQFGSIPLQRSGVMGQSFLVGQSLMTPGPFAVGMQPTPYGLGSSQLITLKKIFAIYDRDSNGRISPREFYRAVKSVNPYIPDPLIMDVLAMYDVNGDCQINFFEFCNLYNQLLQG